MFWQKRLSSSVNYCTKRWELNYIVGRTTLIKVKHASVRIKKIVLDLHGVIVDLKMVVLFEYD